MSEPTNLNPTEPEPNEPPSSIDPPADPIDDDPDQQSGKPYMGGG